MASFLPTTDAGLLAWSANFSALITATPTAYGLTAPQATAYEVLHDAFAAALALATNPATKSVTTVSSKNDARTALKTNARLLDNLVQGTASVTDAQKLSLGLTVRDTQPTPIPAPGLAPTVEVTSVDAWTVNVRMHDAAVPTNRGRPAGVDGAAVFSFVGETAPSNFNLWKFEANTGKTEFAVVFPNTLAAGTKVWITAFWFNPRKQSGPAATPVGTQINYGGLLQAA